MVTGLAADHDREDAQSPLVLEDVSKVYGGRSTHPVRALEDVRLRLNPGEIAALVGPSGCGKSTLLQIAGCLDRPTRGRVILDGLDVTAVPSHRLHRIRNRMVGFIFQQHHLLPNLTAVENVSVPLRYAGAPRRQALDEAMAWLDRVGLADRARHLPAELSGGERQRIAVVRALVNKPRIVLADEPTGELDSAASEQVMSLMLELNARTKAAFLIATHDPGVAGRAHRIIRLQDGRVV